jgi:TrmH family RNA methyltransferase
VPWEIEKITSRQNALLVELHKLSDRKHRTRTEQFRFDGVKLAAEALARGVRLRAMVLRETDALAVLARVCSLSGVQPPQDVRLLSVTDAVFDSLSDESAPEGVICMAYRQQDMHGAWGEVPPIDEHVLLLESVRDPSNLGAIIRSAAAFGVDQLILSEDCADIYNAKTVRASMGTLFSQRIDRAASLRDAIGALRESGRRVLAAALDDRALRLGQFEPCLGDCAVIGNEGHGLSERTLAACSDTLFIPMESGSESLNAAIAASVIMWSMYAGL